MPVKIELNKNAGNGFKPVKIYTRDIVFTSKLTGGNHMPNPQDGNTLKGKKQERRNGHAFHPIMSKGGAHEKSEKAKRKAAKHEMNHKVQEWLGRSFQINFI